MTDKEQLREIERKYNMWADDFNLTPEDVELLIEQAKRVQELESENNALKTVAMSNKFIGEHYRQQKERYRKALNKTRYAIHTQISSINHQENTELERKYIQGMIFASNMINRYFDKALEGEE